MNPDEEITEIYAPSRYALMVEISAIENLIWEELGVKGNICREDVLEFVERLGKRFYKWHLEHTKRPIA